MDRSGRPGLEYFYAFCEEATYKDSMQAFGRNQIRSSKSEIRNKFKIQMLQCSKQKPTGSRFWSFEFGSLDIVSDFVLRISDFQILRKSQKIHRLGPKTNRKPIHPLNRGQAPGSKPAGLQRLSSEMRRIGDFGKHCDSARFRRRAQQTGTIAYGSRSLFPVHRKVAPLLQCLVFKSPFFPLFERGI